MPQIVSQEEWTSLREELPTAEKELTRHRDAVSSARGRLPMVVVDEDYLFTGADGKVGLLELFDGRRQLVVYHFISAPDWDEGCPSCSFLTDHVGRLEHLHQRNTTLVLVSRAPYAKLVAHRRDYPAEG